MSNLLLRIILLAAIIFVASSVSTMEKKDWKNAPLEMFACQVNGKWYRLPERFVSMVLQIPNCRRVYAPIDYEF